MKKYENFIQDESVNKLIEDTENTCIQNNIKLILSDTTHVPYLETSVMMVNGYFSDFPKGILACAIQKPLKDWITILAHESSHMDQYIENCPAYKKLVESRQGAKDVYDLIDEWINGREFSQQELDSFFKIAIDTELDCEKRTVEKLKKYNIPVDLVEYVQNANAYVMFYTYIKKFRKWYIVGKEPYRVSEVLSKMPTNFNNDYYTLTPEREELYTKYCF